MSASSPPETASQAPETGLSADYEVVIRPRARWLFLDWKPLWDYRDLLFLMVRRDFLSRFKQTILGPLWFFINPLVTTLVFTLVFGKVANLSTDGLPQPLFYNSGLLLWGYFSGLFGTVSTTFTGNASVFGKVYFPRLIVPLSNAATNLFTLGIQLVTFIGFYVAYKFGDQAATYEASPWVLVAFPLLTLQSALLALGFGFWMSSVTTRYRDFSHITGFLVQLWMYATPVIYPLSKVPEKWVWLAALNPMTAVTEASRIMLLGRGTLEPWILATSVVATVAIFLTGVLAFQRAERTFIDTV